MEKKSQFQSLNIVGQSWKSVLILSLMTLTLLLQSCAKTVCGDDEQKFGGKCCKSVAKFHPDRDHDGFGDNHSDAIEDCGSAVVEGYVLQAGDCNDQNREINPDQPDLCDEVDNDCDGTLDEDVDKATNPLHCGSCGNQCSFENATAICREGECQFEECDGGFLNLDEDISNGCEYECVATAGGERCNGEDEDCDGLIDEGFDLQADISNCGACGNQCDLDNSTSQCLEGVCAISVCSRGFFDLDQNSANGCEYACVASAAGETCDDEDNDCDGLVDEGLEGQGPVALGLVGVCEGARRTCEGARGFVGEPDFENIEGFELNESLCDNLDNDCDGQIDESVSTDPENCGECGYACSDIHSGATICELGQCMFPMCVDRGNGVEWDLDGDLENGCEISCEQSPLAIDSLDEDEDSIWDGCDTCLNEENPVFQTDTDRDGKGDICDNCPNVANVNQIDTDEDGVGDACDNCLDWQNLDQADADGDGIGDICDVKITTGLIHNCRIRPDGFPECWGGLGTKAWWTPPREANVVLKDMDAGSNHTCAITAEEGRVICWGKNDEGQSTPPPGNETGYEKVSAGFNHTCAIKSGTGEIVCWGSNSYFKSEPPEGNNRNFIQVSSGHSHSCGIKDQTGEIVCWGSNLSQQLATPPANTRYSWVSTGTHFTCAVREQNGQIDCWGEANIGGVQREFSLLGYENFDFETISIDGNQVCGIKSTNHRVICINPFRRDDEVDDEVNHNFVSVSQSQHYGCAIKIGGEVVCWGYLGNLQSTPPSNENLSFSAVTGGEHHTCGIKSGTGEVLCWGSNRSSQTTFPEGVENQGYVTIEAGDSHTCAAKNGGEVVCWGYDTFNRINVPGDRNNFVMVSAGGYHSCGVRSGNGQVVCWGADDGDGEVDNQERGQAIPPRGNDLGYRMVSAGHYHSCGVKEENGSIVCWGDDGQNQPSVPQENNNGFSMVSAGYYHNCALKSGDGQIACWGGNDEERITPPPNGNENFISVSAGRYHSCGLRGNDGEVVCWGDNVYGQTTPPQEHRSGYSSIHAGYNHTCGVKQGRGEVICWGADGEGFPCPPPSQIIPEDTDNELLRTCRELRPALVNQAQ